MSDIEDYDNPNHSLRPVRDEYDEEEEGSDSYDTRRRQYSDDDEEDEEDEDDNDNELRRDGFLVDDNEEEEMGGANEDEEERRRRRKRMKKKKRRHHHHHHNMPEEGGRGEEDELDEEDLALIAENASYHHQPSAGTGERRFKRLKRGRSRKEHTTEEGEELQAELDDLVGNEPSYPNAEDSMMAEEVGGGLREDRGYNDDLGLFGNDEEDDIDMEANDYRASRRMEREYGGGNVGQMNDDGGIGRGRSAAAAAMADREGAGGVSSFMLDSMDAIDEDTWMELQEIFGDGEEYSFAMESGRAKEGMLKEKSLAEVFEPAELEAKMMTQKDEEIRTTDIPERIQMRSTGADSLRPLSDDEINEEATWILGKLHRWHTRMETLRTSRSGDKNNAADSGSGMGSYGSGGNNDAGGALGWGDDAMGGGGGGGGGRFGDMPDYNDGPGANFGGSAGKADPGEKEKEFWPFKEADFMSERFLAGVLEVLKHMSHDFFEVPYIYQHCRELFVTPDSGADGNGGNNDGGGLSGDEPPTKEWLSVDDLWGLFDYEQQYRGFLSSRRYLKNMLRRLNGEGLEGSYEEGGEQSVGEKVISIENEMYASDLIASANCVEDFTDIMEWLQIEYSKEIRSWSQKQRVEVKRAKSIGVWEQMQREGIDKFILRLGISARQVGENVEVPGRHKADNSELTDMPSEMAREYVGLSFSSPDKVLIAAKSTFAQLLAVDPYIRRFVRSYCEEHACINVRPTDIGLRDVTHEEHPAFAFKFIKQKPVVEFTNTAQFLGLEKAVSDGLLKMQFSLTGDYRFDNQHMDQDNEMFEQDSERTARVLTKQLEMHIRSDDDAAGDELSETWNKLRVETLHMAIQKYMLPHIWREMSQKLQQQAFEYVAESCKRSLEKRVNMQTVTNSRMGPGELPRIVVVAGGGFDASSRGALRVVYVDEHGKYIEGFSADSMRSPSEYSDQTGDGVVPLLDLLGRQTTDVIAVAGMSLQTKRLFEDVKMAVDDHCQRSGDDIIVTYANDEVARLWWDSDKAREELPSLRKEERYCVSVARTLQDPLLEYAALGQEILKLDLHSAQRDVDQNALFGRLERAYINVVNRTGVDINELALYPHKQAILQYVSGLGPRKAQGILSKIGSGDKMLESRNDLITRRLCTRYVFVNCASFLRIRPAVGDILDDTRIHPQDYILAYKMALDALDIEEDVIDENNSGGSGRGRGKGKKADGPARYVAEVMQKSPEKLDDLDLVGYAEELKRKNLLKLETLQFIKQEMQHPNDDPREEFKGPNDKKVLEMLTGEIVGETIKEDGTTLVSGTIMRVQPKFAIVKLDSGLEGFINVACVADYRIEEVPDELSPGQTVVGVINRVDLEKMSLDVSIRQSDVNQACNRSQETIPDAKLVDRFFDIDAETTLRERAKALKQKTTARMRTIPHPLFKPFNGREAEQYLASRPRGDCVIRPSSRGTDHIAITWKVGEGLFQHIDVLEKGKPNEAALGLTFAVGASVYTDLDELVAFHVDPIVRKLEEVKRNPKFYDPETDPLYASQPVADILGTNDYSEDYKSRRQNLWETRIARHLDTLAQSTGRGSYCISLSLTKPGALVLAFKPTPTYQGVKKWTARVEPNEFKLGDRGRYPDITGLINGFKSMQTSGAGAGGGGGSSRSSRPSRGYNSGRSGGGGGGGWGSSRAAPSSSGWGERPSASNKNDNHGWNI